MTRNVLVEWETRAVLGNVRGVSCPLPRPVLKVFWFYIEHIWFHFHSCFWESFCWLFKNVSTHFKGNKCSSYWNFPQISQNSPFPVNIWQACQEKGVSSSRFPQIYIGRCHQWVPRVSGSHKIHGTVPTRLTVESSAKLIKVKIKMENFCVLTILPGSIILNFKPITNLIPISL